MKPIDGFGIDEVNMPAPGALSERDYEKVEREEIDGMPYANISTYQRDTKIKPSVRKKLPLQNFDPVKWLRDYRNRKNKHP